MRGMGCMGWMGCMGTMGQNTDDVGGLGAGLCGRIVNIGRDTGYGAGLLSRAIGQGYWAGLRGQGYVAGLWGRAIGARL